MSGAAVIPSLIPLLVVVAMRRAEARLHRQLSEARAFSAESAIALSPSRSIDRRRLAGLIDRGAVRLTPAGLHFLDADGWTRHQADRRHRMLIALTVVVALLGVGAGIIFSMR